MAFDAESDILFFLRSIFFISHILVTVYTVPSLEWALVYERTGALRDIKYEIIIVTK